MLRWRHRRANSTRLSVLQICAANTTCGMRWTCGCFWLLHSGCFIVPTHCPCLSGKDHTNSECSAGSAGPGHCCLQCTALPNVCTSLSCDQQHIGFTFDGHRVELIRGIAETTRLFGPYSLTTINHCCMPFSTSKCRCFKARVRTQ